LESLREKGHLQDEGVDESMGSKWTSGRLVGGVEWIHLAQDRDRWRAVGHAVINLRVLTPKSYLFIYLVACALVHCILENYRDNCSTPSRVYPGPILSIST
jgi:hypothetical protein